MTCARRCPRWLLGFVAGWVALVAVGQAGADDGEAFSLTLRKQVETQPGSGRFQALTERQPWNPRETAIIVCDMWDLHHCLNATLRGTEVAPRMNEVLNAARSRGATIIHAPSSCMDAYATHPARMRALQTPRSQHLPENIEQWCDRIPAEEKGQYPIDQSDGGEDDEPEAHQKWAAELTAKGRNPRAPWKSQTAAIEIHDQDFISDQGEEIWSVLESQKIEHVILLGVHTNMCVLGRPFGLRQLAKNGKHVVLMRDMTDTMYNPAREPYVSHFTGTDLIVEHIEKWVCPTITSDQILGGKPFRFSKDTRPHLVVVMSEPEYETNRTLPDFCRRNLGKDFRISYVFGGESEPNDLPGIEVLSEADLALISVRRRVLSTAQFEIVRQFVESGKPIVGVRTASHAFSLNNQPVPEGHVAWEAFDHDVLGGNYTGHHGVGPNVEIAVAPGVETHPILRGVNIAELKGFGSLYKTAPLAKTSLTLLIGSIPNTPSEPVAWVNQSKYGGRVFYTALAHPDDFTQPAFNRLLKNGLSWAAGLPVADGT